MLPGQTSLRNVEGVRLEQPDKEKLCGNDRSLLARPEFLYLLQGPCISRETVFLPGFLLATKTEDSLILSREHAGTFSPLFSFPSALFVGTIWEHRFVLDGDRDAHISTSRPVENIINSMLYIVNTYIDNVLI